MIETMGSFGRILIADSDESALLTTNDLLQKAGYQCTLVREGIEAFRALEADQYDLLITEIRMPGNEELELIQGASRYRDGVPVIIYTQYPSLRTAIASIQLPVTAYLIKPVEPSFLIHQVKMGIASAPDLKRRATSGEGLDGCRDEVDRIDQLTSAIREAIQVLKSTQISFRSRKLAVLRRKLEQLLNTEQAG
jgi:DNA-binding NtrC family response regulator